MVDVDQGVTHVMSHACINQYQGSARKLSSDHLFLLRNAVGHVIQRMVPGLLFPPRLFLRVNPLPIGGSRVGTGDRCCGLRPRLPGMPRVEEAGRGVLGGNAQQGRPALHVRPYNVRPLYETLIIYIYIFIYFTFKMG